MHRSISKYWPHPSLMLICVKLYFTLSTRSSLPLMPAMLDEACTNPTTLENQVADTA